MLEFPLPFRLLGSGASWGEVTSSPQPPTSLSFLSPRPHLACLGLRAVSGERKKLGGKEPRRLCILFGLLGFLGTSDL